MSELIIRNTNGHIRERLLTTVCALALSASTVMARDGQNADSGRPTVWLELGAQVERLGASQEVFDPAFLNKFDYLNFEPILPVQHPSRYAVGGEGKFTLEPAGSDWAISASIRYGRSNGQRSRYQQLSNVPINQYTRNVAASASNSESHAILDFQVGKDVGLGLFPAELMSHFSLGARLVQFSSRRQASFNGDPDTLRTGSQKYGVLVSHHHYLGLVDAKHDFQGIGPSLAWSASKPLIGKDEDQSITLDWGVNAAVLFGRQKVRGEHKQTGMHYSNYQRTNLLLGIQKHTHSTTGYNHSLPIDRSRSVVVPNLGGFAGMSFRYSAAKISLGYRADFFFSAMDGGIDTRKSYNQSFYGPFATISIGFP